MFSTNFVCIFSVFSGYIWFVVKENKSNSTVEVNVSPSQNIFLTRFKMRVRLTRLSQSRIGNHWQWDEVNLHKLWTVLEGLPQYDATRKLSLVMKL